MIILPRNTFNHRKISIQILRVNIWALSYWVEIKMNASFGSLPSNGREIVGRSHSRFVHRHQYLRRDRCEHSGVRHGPGSHSERIDEGALAFKWSIISPEAIIWMDPLWNIHVDAMDSKIIRFILVICIRHINKYTILLTPTRLCCRLSLEYARPYW